MILRAVFWIAVVSFFLPREPDLGLGRPGGAQGGIGGLIARVEASSAATTPNCTAKDCAASLSPFSMLHGFAARSVDDVRADIEQSRHARAAELAENATAPHASD